MRYIVAVWVPGLEPSPRASKARMLPLNNIPRFKVTIRIRTGTRCLPRNDTANYIMVTFCLSSNPPLNQKNNLLVYPTATLSYEGAADPLIAGRTGYLHTQPC